MRQFSSATLLVQGGTLVTPEGLLEADLLAQGQRIKSIGRNLEAVHDTRVVDAGGCYVLPGVIDAHTHIALDTGIYHTADDWFTGTRAAAYGGITTVIDFATQLAGQTLRETVLTRKEEAQNAIVDYGLHVILTDMPPGRETELADLVELGTPSIKLFTTYRPNYYLDDGTLLRLMKAAAEVGILPLVHCENDALVTARIQALEEMGRTAWRYHGHSRPVLAEHEAIGRVLLLAAAAGSPVHICHCSSARSVAQVVEARKSGQAATCETCPQYLILDNTRYTGPGPWRYILQPPLRTPEERDGLWALVAAGAVDMLTTDHCDYTKEDKRAVNDFTRTPGGLPGTETLLPLTYTYGVHAGRLSLIQLSDLLSSNPARVWGMWPRKGALLPGSDADLVVYDPEPESILTAERLHHVAGYTPYEGIPVQGRVRATISRGQVIIQDGQFRGRPGRGRFVERAKGDS